MPGASLLEAAAGGKDAGWEAHWAGSSLGVQFCFPPQWRRGSVAKADGERKGALLCLRSQEAEALRLLPGSPEALLLVWGDSQPPPAGLCSCSDRDIQADELVS